MRLFFKNGFNSNYKKGVIIYIISISLTIALVNSSINLQVKNFIYENLKSISEKIINTDTQEITNSIEIPETYSGRIQVTGGTTFIINIPIDDIWRKNISRRVSLYGVTSCEVRQFATMNNTLWPCGVVSTAWLVTKTFDQQVSCKTLLIKNQTHYAQCTINGNDLALMGITAGMMILPMDQENFKSPIQYQNSELVAKKEKIGLWSSNFERPEKWIKDNGLFNPLDPDYNPRR